MIKMVRDIKTRKKQPKTIKTMKGTVKSIDRSFRVKRDIKDISDRVLSQDATESTPAELLQLSEQKGAEIAGRKTIGAISRSPRAALSVKQKKEAAKQSIKTAKATVKETRNIAKSEIKSVKSSVKAAKNTVKTATATTKMSSSTIKETSSATKSSLSAAKTAGKAALHAVKTTAKAVQVAVKATAKAIVSSAEAVVAFIAAGGWIVLVILVLIILFSVLFSSAFGVHFADDVNNNALTTAKQELNSEFVIKLNEEKSKMQGYDRIVIRPAPTITKWNEILAVYSVRAQSQNLIPAEINEQTKALLSGTMWDMISFATSSETVSSTENDENGITITVTETFGVVTVIYKNIDEVSSLYNFSDSEKEMLSQVLSMYSEFEGISISGNGKMINPCPAGRFNGNDYPSYAGNNEYHAGRDISCPIGTPIYAAADGTVIHINDQADSYGNHIMIAHGNEVYTLYAHCDSLLVTVGQEVSQGEQIAWSGATGNVTGPHLHFEVREGGSRFRVNNVDPLDWIMQ